MILADKIIELRKKSNMTQDELAEKLGVSRQSVSKWEGAQSTPDLNRILKMAELFSVSTDVLLKDELDLTQSFAADASAPSITSPDETEPPLRHVSMAEANEFLEKNNRRASLTALGVALCILSPTMAILSDIIFGDSPLADLGAIFLFMFIAAAVGIFIYAESLTKKFNYLKHECLDTEYGVDGMVSDRKNRYQSKHTMQIIIGITLCILSMIPTIVAEALTDSLTISDICCVLLFLSVASGVFLMVKTNITNGGFKILLEEDVFKRQKKLDDKKIGTPIGVYWLIVTAIYLTYSFITFEWGKSWIIWPIAGVLCPIAALIFKTLKNKND